MNNNRAKNKNDRVKSHIVVDNGSGFISIDDVEAIYGFSVSTLAKWRMGNKFLPFYKIGKYVKYRKDDIEAFILSQINKVN